MACGNLSLPEFEWVCEVTNSDPYDDEDREKLLKMGFTEKDYVFEAGYWGFEVDASLKGEMCISSTEDCQIQVDVVIEFLQAFLKTFRPDTVVTFSTSWGADRNVMDTFGGAAYGVTATDHEVVTTDNLEVEFMKKRQLKNSGIKASERITATIEVVYPKRVVDGRNIFTDYDKERKNVIAEACLALENSVNSKLVQVGENTFQVRLHIDCPYE